MEDDYPKVLVFSLKKKVVQCFTEIELLYFDSRHDSEILTFTLEDDGLRRMSIDLHTKLCEALSPILNQFQLAGNHASQEYERHKNELKLKNIRHFENLLNPPGDSK